MPAVEITAEIYTSLGPISKFSSSKSAPLAVILVKTGIQCKARAYPGSAVGCQSPPTGYFRKGKDSKQGGASQIPAGEVRCVFPAPPVGLPAPGRQGNVPSRRQALFTRRRDRLRRLVSRAQSGQEHVGGRGSRRGISSGGCTPGSPQVASESRQNPLRGDRIRSGKQPPLTLRRARIGARCQFLPERLPGIINLSCMILLNLGA